MRMAIDHIKSFLFVAQSSFLRNLHRIDIAAQNFIVSLCSQCNFALRVLQFDITHKA